MWVREDIRIVCFLWGFLGKMNWLIVFCVFELEVENFGDNRILHFVSPIQQLVHRRLRVGGDRKLSEYGFSKSL
jgi:hypothetical protein